MHKSKKRDGYVLIFRRYRKLKDGTILDSQKYGFRAWPLWVKSENS
jgi:hypothetical protein